MDLPRFLFLLLLLPPISTANLHKSNQLFRSQLFDQSTSSNDTPPTLYFEVTKSITLPSTKPCSYHILHHDFGYTYAKPPVLADYTPPSHCPFQDFSKIVLQWKATCKGRQFDRIFGVWLGGVELLRSCTAEPRASGTVWTVEKDITRYYSLLMKDNTLAVYLGNLVDSTYTGVYHVDISIHFYPVEKALGDFESRSQNLALGYGGPADLILPISRDLPLNDGLWFEIENSTDVGSKEFKIPQNAYRAVLEVYVSFHENDEFWYTNPPDEYLAANNLTNSPGNGPFREVVITLDGDTVGAIWPFTVIYTGGVNPLLWRPITGIGSFDLPSYDIEITPFLGKILDGDAHSLGFSVTNALNVWYIDANLHLWLDEKSSQTEGELLSYNGKPLVESLVSDFVGLNGNFWTSARRSILSSGWVRSSHGNITTSFVQDLSYNNSMAFGKDGSMQIVEQIILFNDTIHAKPPSPSPSSYFIDETHRKFSIHLYSDEVDQPNGTYLAVANLTLGFEESKSKSKEFGFSNSSLKNVQNGQGIMVVKNNLVISGLGSTQQDYEYKGTEFCYFRNVSSSNYTILYDKVENSCHERSRPCYGFSFSKLPILFKGPFSTGNLRKTIFVRLFDAVTKQDYDNFSAKLKEQNLLNLVYCYIAFVVIVDVS
ncbi:peptide-N4-(N-acetyl-beta-glucosaminyl)asparagine amidase A [Senna tora]|uniref:Peptide-N4-(N-acetyl-beta-glucosaminyl)asparagine amidase A n=1 Tax=Senna tora TaxID=362788 RepID=A0A834TJV8_9FABA|nr:peptide-N4-(N-acetyl-beta-glucosaminyl)asparagine amidase A [Senna tora]